MNTHYDKSFFEGQKGGSVRSATEVVPIVIYLFDPKSVVDVGCGVGTWLKVFVDKGITDVLGIDGEYVDRKQLVVPADKFMPHDLEKSFPSNKKFDLAISLEVGEHLPEHSAEQFVKTLTSLAPVVLFSAAIPFQGGTHHINERWQSYWAEKFNKNGFVPTDIIRKKIWTNNEVQPWYKQNIVLYIDKTKLVDQNFPIKNEDEVTEFGNLDVVHPEIYLQAVDPAKMHQQQILRAVKATPHIVKKLL